MDTLNTLAPVVVGAFIGFLGSLAVMNKQFEKQQIKDDRDRKIYKIDQAKNLVDLIMANAQIFTTDKNAKPPLILSLYELKGIVEMDLFLNKQSSRFEEITMDFIDKIYYQSSSDDINKILLDFHNECKALKKEIQDYRL